MTTGQSAWICLLPFGDGFEIDPVATERCVELAVETYS